MDNRSNMLQLCRLCLVKDDVNIPIFEEHGDIRQIFLKITSCLPVKVSRDDKLPKKICDGCSYKLETLYEFWNTSVNAEKQLLAWLGEAGMNSEMADGTITAVAQQIKPTDTFVKQETVDPPDVHSEDHDQKDYVFQQKFESASAGPSATVTSNEEEEPPPKRARRTAAVKAAIAMDRDSDDDDDSGEPITKVEDESEESDGEDHTFADAPSTSADDQPGPSGVGKDGVDAPNYLLNNVLEEIVISIVDEDSDEHSDSNCYDAKNFTINLNSYEKKESVNLPLTDLLLINGKLLETNKSENNISEPKLKLKTYLCSFCGKMVRSKNFSKHIACHGEKHCKICTASFKTIEGLKNHRKLHLQNDRPCVKCNLSFKKPLDFAVHLFKHTGEYSCPMCNFCTKSKSSFIGHTKLHERKYGHHCTICGKGFLSKALLTTHEEIHLDIKRYSCDVCEKKFSVKRYLDVHRSLNHRKELFGIELLYKCDLCGREFTFEKSLRRHQSVIHHIGEDRTVECEVCHKIIANNYNLKLHMRTHTGEKKYCCDLCGKAFSAYKYWKKHRLTHEQQTSSRDLKDNENEQSHVDETNYTLICEEESSSSKHWKIHEMENNKFED